jgi:hypothetical protein
MKENMTKTEDDFEKYWKSLEGVERKVGAMNASYLITSCCFRNSQTQRKWLRLNRRYVPIIGMVFTQSHILLGAEPLESEDARRKWGA